MRNSNLRKKGIKYLSVVIIICLLIFFLFYKSIFNLITKKYINEYFEKYYKDYSIEYIDKEKCYSAGGVLFPFKIDNCNMFTYIVKKDNYQFKLIITDNRSKKYYTQGLFVYSLENERCKEKISCSDGNICGETSEFIDERPEFNDGCVTVIKKY